MLEFVGAEPIPTSAKYTDASVARTALTTMGAGIGVLVSTYFTSLSDHGIITQGIWCNPDGSSYGYASASHSNLAALIGSTNSSVRMEVVDWCPLDDTRAFVLFNVREKTFVRTLWGLVVEYGGQGSAVTLGTPVRLLEFDAAGDYVLDLGNMPGLLAGYAAIETYWFDIDGRYGGSCVALSSGSVAIGYSMEAGVNSETWSEYVLMFRRLAIATELAKCCAKEMPGRCFVGAEKFDVLADGRKIAGAAQKRNKRGLLIQGSIQPRAGWNRSSCCPLNVRAAVTARIKGISFMLPPAPD